MDAFVRLGIAGGPGRPAGSACLHHGGLIGRLASAALVINDPRVSEAHAVISRRGGGLCLLALRRRVFVDGAPVREAQLAAGQTVTLADGIDLTVDEVHAPAQALALTAPGLGQRLLAPVTSVLPGTPWTLAARFVPDAAAVIWSAGDQWRVRVAGEVARPVGPGDELHLGRTEFRFVLAASQRGGATTAADGPDQPLRLRLDGDTVAIERGARQVTLTGLGARLVIELVAVAGPLAWAPLARQLWPGDASPIELRRRLDAVVQRLRTTLRRAGIRTDLIGADGAGQLQLVLYQHDVVDGERR